MASENGGKRLYIYSSHQRLKDKIKIGTITDRFGFKIKLNKVLDETSVNNKTVTVLDESGTQCPYKIGYDKSTQEILVNPGRTINENKRYTLVLSEHIRAISGESFGKPLSLSFSIALSDVGSDGALLPAADTQEKSKRKKSGKKIFLLLLLLLLLPILYFAYTTVDGAGYTDGTGVMLPMDEVLGNYGWRIDVVGKYVETTYMGSTISAAYYSFEKISGKSDAYIVHLINKNSKSSDIKFSIIDEAGKTVEVYVLPRRHFSEMDTDIRIFSIDFKKRKVYAVNRLLTRDNGGYDFINTE